MKIKWWIVSLNGKVIDKVPYDDCPAYATAADVKKSLVDHDHYDPRIKVRAE